MVKRKFRIWLNKLCLLLFESLNMKILISLYIYMYINNKNFILSFQPTIKKKLKNAPLLILIKMPPFLYRE